MDEESYYQKNREKRIQYQKEYYLKNREKIREYDRLYYLKNIETRRKKREPIVQIVPISKKNPINKECFKIIFD